MFNATLIKQHCTQDGSSINLHIDLSGRNITCAGAQVLAIGMHVNTEKEDGEYWDGDLYVSWDGDGLSNDDSTAGQLLMRDPANDDDVTAIMGAFYWEQQFNAQLAELLQEAGFSAAAANVSGSEWGMQDEERASYDAYEVADEVRKAFGIV